jgi:hypothetical protein
LIPFGAVRFWTRPGIRASAEPVIGAEFADRAECNTILAAGRKSLEMFQLPRPLEN